MMKLIKKNSSKNQDFVIEKKMMMNNINKTSFKIIRLIEILNSKIKISIYPTIFNGKQNIDVATRQYVWIIR